MATVVARTPIARDIIHLSLEGQTPLPSYSAGAHIDLHLANGLTRQYSLCGPETGRAAPSTYDVAVLRSPTSRGGSDYIHAALHPGSELEIGRPRNLFELVPASHSVLVAGGIGITPLYAMAMTLHQQHQRFELHYTMRSAQCGAFLNELTQGPFGDRCWLYTDDYSVGPRIDTPALIQPFSPSRHLYVCGPAGLMDAVVETAYSVGWPDANIHLERFSVSPSIADAERESGFTIHLARSCRTLWVSPDRSIADTLLENGIDVPLSCEQGICGTCIVPVLEGIPDHRDAVLSPEERAKHDRMTICCSRAQSDRLVLDL